jgi:hypothetical protein
MIPHYRGRTRVVQVMTPTPGGESPLLIDPDRPHLS